MDVEAKVIDAELATISKAEEWLAEASERVAERCELYRPPELLESEKDYKAAKAARAQCRKDATEIDNERKALLRGMKDALKKFENEVKDVLSPLTDLDAQYKVLIDSYEDLCRTDRQIELAEEYKALAPDLVPIVPFDLILSCYGNERGKAWLNRSTNIVAAKDMLANAIYDISENEKAIDSLVPEQDRTEVKALFFKTLDLNSSLAEARRIKEQRNRVRMLENERLARERAYAAAAANPEVNPEPIVQPAPVEPDAHSWVISVPMATKVQMQMVADFMRANGIAFDRIYSGTIKDVCAREV